MQALKESNIAHITAVPGLYISDITVPSSPVQLEEHGITHVLSLLNDSSRTNIPESLGIVHKRIEIDDDPLSDLLVQLEEICSWIDNALSPPIAGNEEKDMEKGKREARVLVHCFQGISRSGAVVVAYLMQTLPMSYPAAVKIARSYRPVIMPNGGFETQLRLWESMRCSIYMNDEEEAREDPGEKAGKGIEEERRLKQQYVAWRDGRWVEGDERERNKVRAKGMGALAARFGALRRERLGDEGEEELVKVVERRTRYA